MTHPDLDKLEAAINSCENERQLAGLLSTINFQDKHPEYAMDVLHLIKAHLSAQAGVPDGWQLVPKEPTIEMTNKVVKYFTLSSKNLAVDCYKAMIAAAPYLNTNDGRE